MNGGSTKNSQHTFSSVIQFFKENYEISTSGRDNLKLGNRTHTPKQFSVKFSEEKENIADYAGMAEFYGIVEDIKARKKYDRDKALDYMADQVFGALNAELRKAAKEKVSKVDTSAIEIMNKSFNYSGYLPVLDVGSKQRVMFNTIVKGINREASYDSWKEWASTRPADEKKILLSTVTPAVIKYDPKNIQEVRYTKVQDQEEVLTLNAHITPEWRLKEIKDAVLPDMFVELMEHLFPDEESRDYVFHWMNFMLTDRNHCILFLHGEQGTGKGTLAYIFKELVGATNYTQLGHEFWSARFNGEIKYRRCVVFDDNEITKHNVARIRAMTNRTIAIEEKGMTTVNLDNHASYVWTMNPDKEALITGEDRRYSVPLIASEDIQRVKGAEWMDKLTHLTQTDSEFIGQIGHWILQQGDKGNFNNTKPFITDNFYGLVEKALTLWQRFLVDTIESKANDKYNLSDAHIKEGLAGTGHVKVKGFLDTYRDRDGDRIGYVSQEPDRSRVVIPTKKYWSQDILDNEKKTQGDYHDITF